MFLFSSYGDRRPKTFGGKLFAVLWTLTGQVVILILTSLVAGHLTTYSLKIDRSLYGKQVRIFTGSRFKTGLHYQSFCDHSRNFANLLGFKGVIRHF